MAVGSRWQFPGRFRFFFRVRRHCFGLSSLLFRPRRHLFGHVLPCWVMMPFFAPFRCFFDKMAFVSACFAFFCQQAVRGWFSLRAKCGFGGRFQFLGAQLKTDGPEAAGLDIGLSLIRFFPLQWLRGGRGAAFGCARLWRRCAGRGASPAPSRILTMALFGTACLCWGLYPLVVNRFCPFSPADLVHGTVSARRPLMGPTHPTWSQKATIGETS